jgi:hypothetical protein
VNKTGIDKKEQQNRGDILEEDGQEKKESN